MKNFISDALNVCKKLEISNDYDCKTELKNGDTTYFTMQLKGDYAVKVLHVAIGITAISAACMIGAVGSAVKRRSCCKK